MLLDTEADRLFSRSLLEMYSLISYNRYSRVDTESVNSG